MRTKSTTRNSRRRAGGRTSPHSPSWRRRHGARSRQERMERRLDPRERRVDRVVGDDSNSVDIGHIVGGVKGRAAALPRCIDGVDALERGRSAAIRSARVTSFMGEEDGSHVRLQPGRGSRSGAPKGADTGGDVGHSRFGVARVLGGAVERAAQRVKKASNGPRSSLSLAAASASSTRWLRGMIQDFTLHMRSARVRSRRRRATHPRPARAQRSRQRSSHAIGRVAARTTQNSARSGASSPPAASARRRRRA